MGSDLVELCYGCYGVGVVWSLYFLVVACELNMCV